MTYCSGIAAMFVLWAASGCQLFTNLEDAPESDVQCDDTIDNDNNGATDCDDSNCASSVICQGQLSTCGNNTIERATEQCDDGNINPGDGCAPNCQIETALDRPVQRISPPSLMCSTVSSNGGRKLGVGTGKHAVMLCGPDVYVANAPSYDMAFLPPAKIDFQSPAPFREVEIVDSGDTQHVAGLANDLLYYARSTDGGSTWTNIKLLAAQPPLGKFISVDAVGATVAIAVSGPGVTTQVFVNRGGGAAAWTQINTTGITNLQCNIRINPAGGELQLLGSNTANNGLTFAFSINGMPFISNETPPLLASGTSWAGTGDRLFFIGDALSAGPETVNSVGWATLNVAMPLNPPLPPQAANEHRSISAGGIDTVFVAQVNAFDNSLMVQPVAVAGSLPIGPVARFGAAPHVAAHGTGYVVTWSQGGQVFSSLKVGN